ncbi:MAG: Serine aminopeptidase [Phenylobacterium sp.]|nr:Serine aminopeptidase [Phenylobacterium sp.]
MDLGCGMASKSRVLHCASRSASAEGPAEVATRLDAVAFDGSFGALHRPAQAAANGVTVLICPPVGRDARCAYRPLFLFAEDLAARGFSVLRYDHLGGGDSLPLGAEVDQWALWAAGVEQAAAFARAHADGTALVLAGLRIGASLAALAAEAVRPDGLMLLAPIASGRAWTRELQMAATMVGLEPNADGSIEIDGLRLSRATIAALQGFDMKTLRAPGARVFLASPGPDARLAANLGPEVTRAPFEGYSELFKEAHLNAPPAAVFDDATAWLETFAEAAAAEPAAPAAPEPPPARLAGVGWSEEPVLFGPGLRGVLCLPAEPSGRQAVIFGNTGGDPRSGIGGFASQACRTLAARGVAALRFDFAGLGESASPGEWRPHVYETSRTPDLRAAAQVLERHGYDETVLVGVCAGGYQALRGAMDEPRFRRVMAINSWLVWRESESLELKRANVGKRRRINVFALARLSGWRRLLRHEIEIRSALATLAGSIARRLSFRAPDAPCREMRAGVERIARDGARVRIVVGRDDESLEGLEADFGIKGRWLARRPGVEVRMVAQLDHGLFSRDSQALALEELMDFLGLEPSARRAAARARRPANGPATLTFRGAHAPFRGS